MKVKKEPIGLLFGELPYESTEELGAIIENIKYQQAFYFIHKALIYSYSNGVFSMTESEIISKSLRIFSDKNISNDTE